jgi:hypothetical protein
MVNENYSNKKKTREGQQGSIARMWVPKGSRPRAIRQQQFASNPDLSIVDLQMLVGRDGQLYVMDPIL